MRNLYLLVMLCLCAALSHAQGTTGYSGTGANINVDNYQIWWRLNPDSSRGIKGIVKTKFRTTSSNVTAVSFDLRSTLIIDSVNHANVNVAVTRTGNTFSVPVNIPVSGTRDSVIVYYHGVPPPINNQEEGFSTSADPAVSGNTSGAGNNINTLSESYEDRDWWPCKADMQDKADTVDITVNVPWKKTSATDTFWVASNGTLVDSTINTDNSRTFKYINRYPMASYLVCVSVSRYDRYYRGTVNLGAGINVPVVFYLFSGKTVSRTNAVISAMDTATKMVSLFSQVLGNYGFTDPLKGGKHGFYEGLTPGGGMEHQTFSGIGTESLTSVNTLIHELAHQWFGDKVSFATWQRVLQNIFLFLRQSVLPARVIRLRSGQACEAPL